MCSLPVNFMVFGELHGVWVFELSLILLIYTISGHGTALLGYK